MLAQKFGKRITTKTGKNCRGTPKHFRIELWSFRIKTRDKHYVAQPSDSDLQQLFQATDEIRKQIRERRKNPDICSATNSEMPEYEFGNAAEAPTIISVKTTTPHQSNHVSHQVQNVQKFFMVKDLLQ